MKYRDENGIWQELYLPPTGDTLPIGAEVDYDGEDVPYGWEEVDEKSKILWTNPDPTSSFSAQNISLSSSDYDMYEVIFYGSTTGAVTLTTGRIPKGENCFLQQIYNTGSDGTHIRNRSIDYVSDTSLSVKIGQFDGTTNNIQNIPVYVIGYKTGLFEQGSGS